MNNRFTERAQRVVLISQEEAKRLSHDYVGTEHILLGLIALNEGVAAQVLSNLCVDLRKARAELEHIVGTGNCTLSLGEVPFTPRAKKVLEYGVEEAQHLGHTYVGTEHLLLGLLRETEGLAAQILEKLGLKLPVVRAEVLNLIFNADRERVTPVGHRSAESNPRLTMFIANLMKCGVSVSAICEAAQNCGEPVRDKPLIRFAESLAEEVISK